MTKKYKVTLEELKADFDLFQNYVKENLIRLSERMDGFQGQMSGIDRRIDDVVDGKVGYKELKRLLQPIRKALDIIE